MKTKPVKPDPQKTSTSRWWLLLGLFATVALYLLGVTYWINSDSTGNVTATGGEQAQAAATRLEEARDASIRRRMVKADEKLLSILAEKKALLESQREDRRSRAAKIQYVNTFKSQVLDTIDSVGPEARPLVEDLRKKAEDPDFTAEYQ
ncbi:MAG: hypothetical protein AB8B50_02525 [Pirellulaceae bacterium]